MEKHFYNTRADMETLSKDLINYLHKEGFNVKLKRNGESIYVITAEKIVKGKVKLLMIEILKDKDNSLVINFRNRHELKPPTYSSLIWQFLGGGFLLKGIYEDVEFYQQIEKRFWRMVEELMSAYGESSAHS
ncbi:MAG: hypothetical protein QXG09_05030 [Candidatus Bathyarchaeia archaeon]